MTQIHAFPATPEQEQPHSIEAEQQILGALLGDNALLDLIADSFRAEMFFDPVHRIIHEAIQARVASGQIATPVTVKSDARVVEALHDLGGPGYLVRLVGGSISPRYIRDYAGIVHGMWIKRRALAAIREHEPDIAGGTEDNAPVAALAQALQPLLAPVGRATSQSGLSALTDAVRGCTEVYQGTRSLSSTGIVTLDERIGGMAPGDLMLLGGATSMGKTAVAVHIAQQKAKAGERVVFWSREMEPDAIMQRMISAECGVEYAKIRNASSLTDAEFRKVIQKAQDLESIGLRIVPKHVQGAVEGEAAIRRAAQEMGGDPAVVIVDYAQLVRGEGRTMYERNTDVADRLKDLGGNLGCPVIALVQLGRDIAGRDNKRPMLTDIKESGQYENNADHVVLCHRPEYWLRRQGPQVNRQGEVTDEARADYEADLSRWKNRLQLIVAKNRQGEVADTEVGIHVPTNRIWRLGSEDDPVQGDAF